MKHQLTRVVVGLAAVVLGAATLGCGFISQAKQAVDNLTAVSDVMDLLDRSAQLTFTANYTLVDGGGTATVVQQPPNASFTGRDGRFIMTPEHVLMCTGKGAQATCQRSPNNGAEPGSADSSAHLQAVAGGGFISTPMALAMLTIASVTPGVEVSKSSKKIAGLASTCLTATGIPQDQAENTVQAKDYTVCVADNGVLTAFTATGTDDVKLGVELAEFSQDVDPKAFVAPAGVRIVDVGQLEPPR